MLLFRHCHGVGDRIIDIYFQNPKMVMEQQKDVEVDGIVILYLNALIPHFIQKMIADNLK